MPRPDECFEDPPQASLAIACLGTFYLSQPHFALQRIFRVIDRQPTREYVALGMAFAVPLGRSRNIGIPAAFAVWAVLSLRRMSISCAGAV